MVLVQKSEADVDVNVLMCVCVFVCLSLQTPRSSSESPLMKKSPALASLVANKKGGRRLRIDLKKGAAARLSHVAACSSVVVWSCSGRAVGGREDGWWKCGEVKDIFFSTVLPASSSRLDITKQIEGT